MNHLEQLTSEWLEYRGYIVRRNIHVGRRDNGGYEGELDIVAFHPETNHLFHIELSMDAHDWTKREKRFQKKFESGKKYIIKEIFPWLLDKNPDIEQWAVIWASDKNHKKISEGKMIPIKDFYKLIGNYIKDIRNGKIEGNAIPEHFPLLRTMQFAIHWCKE